MPMPHPSSHFMVCLLSGISEQCVCSLLCMCLVFLGPLAHIWFKILLGHARCAIAGLFVGLLCRLAHLVSALVWAPPVVACGGGGGGPLGGRTACRSRAFVFLEGRYWLFALEGLMPHSWAQRLSASSRIRLSEAAWVVPERWLVLVLRWSAHALVCGCVCWQLRSGCLSVACGAGGACLRSSGPERRMIRSSRVCPLHVLMSCPARSRSESPKQRRFLMHRPQIAASLSLSASLHIVYSLAQAPMAA